MRKARRCGVVWHALFLGVCALVAAGCTVSPTSREDGGANADVFPFSSSTSTSSSSGGSSSVIFEREAPALVRPHVSVTCPACETVKESAREQSCEPKELVVRWSEDQCSDEVRELSARTDLGLAMLGQQMDMRFAAIDGKLESCIEDRAGEAGGDPRSVPEPRCCTIRGSRRDRPPSIQISIEDRYKELAKDDPAAAQQLYIVDQRVLRRVEELQELKTDATNACVPHEEIGTAIRTLRGWTKEWNGKELPKLDRYIAEADEYLANSAALIQVPWFSALLDLALGPEFCANGHRLILLRWLGSMVTLVWSVITVLAAWSSRGLEYRHRRELTADDRLLLENGRGWWIVWLVAAAVTFLLVRWTGLGTNCVLSIPLISALVGCQVWLFLERPSRRGEQLLHLEDRFDRLTEYGQKSPDRGASEFDMLRRQIAQDVLDRGRTLWRWREDRRRSGRLVLRWAESGFRQNPDAPEILDLRVALLLAKARALVIPKTPSAELNRRASS